VYTQNPELRTSNFPPGLSSQLRTSSMAMPWVDDPPALSRTLPAMKLPAAAYFAEVATSATKAGSYGVFGEGESTSNE
jgi:hypothetical protein